MKFRRFKIGMVGILSRKPAVEGVRFIFNGFEEGLKTYIFLNQKTDKII